MREEIAGLETAMRAEIGKVDDRGKELATAMRELTAQVSTALERSFGTRRLVRGGARGARAAGCGRDDPAPRRAGRVLPARRLTAANGARESAQIARDSGPPPGELASTTARTAAKLRTALREEGRGRLGTPPGTGSPLRTGRLRSSFSSMEFAPVTTAVSTDSNTPRPRYNPPRPPGRGSVWKSTWFGIRGSQVQILPPRRGPSRGTGPGPPGGHRPGAAGLFSVPPHSGRDFHVLGSHLLVRRCMLRRSCRRRSSRRYPHFHCVAP